MQAKSGTVRYFYGKIKYLGQIIQKEGKRQDSERATVIKNMPAPENLSSLQSFLGLANH